MNFKNINHNVSNFSKNYWSKDGDIKSFIRHFYLVYAFLRGKDITKVESPKSSIKKVNVGMFCIILNHLQKKQDISKEDIAAFTLFFTERGYKTSDLSYKHWMPRVYCNQLITNSTQLLPLAKDLLSDNLITKEELNSWKAVKSILHKSNLSWEVKMLLKEFNALANKRLIYTGTKTDSLLQIDVKELSLKITYSLENGKLYYSGNNRPVVHVYQEDSQVYTTNKDNCWEIIAALKKLDLIKKGV